jgi:MSHA pilin protein MshD
MTRTSRQRGFTLIELIIFIVVVGAGLAGILSVSTNAIKSSADPLIRKQTVAIAESLLEEILQKDYAKPTGSTATGFSAGGARNLYDCVDDYDNYITSAGIVKPDAAATPVSGLSSYNISPKVTVTATTLGSLSVKMVVVSVTGPQGTFSLTGYRACDLSPSCPLP